MDDYVTRSALRTFFSGAPRRSVHHEAGPLRDLPKGGRDLLVSGQEARLWAHHGMIAKKVTELTADYRLGFGSFSDKPTPPFSSELSYYEKVRTIV